MNIISESTANLIVGTIFGFIIGCLLMGYGWSYGMEYNRKLAIEEYKKGKYE